MYGIPKDSRFDFCGSGIKFQCVCFFAIEPISGDKNGSVIIYAEIFQSFLAVILRFARGQNGTSCIDESATIDGNTIRIGNDHISFMAGYFQKSIHRRRISAGHLVHNDFRRTLCHIGIALHVTGQFRFG